MNKERFLQALCAQLSCLDQEDIQEIIEEYRLLIEEKISMGQSETEILKEMDTPEEIAKGYIIELQGEDIYNDLQLKQEKRRSEQKRLDDEKKHMEKMQHLQKARQYDSYPQDSSKETKNIVLFVVLQLFHIFFLLPSLFTVIFTLFGVGASGLALIFAAGTSALLPVGLGLKIIAALMILSIGVLLLNATIAICMFIYKIGKRYVLWNASLIR